jgi:very-short-patch-repair endonuclease
MTIRPSTRPSDLTKQRVRELRSNATEPERILWAALRGRNVGGLKFRRQHPIEPYIVDFYCAEARLIVELDGESHNDQVEYDLARVEFLRRLGLTIFRVTNDDVLENIDGLARAIQKAAFTKLGKPHP